MNSLKVINNNSNKDWIGDYSDFLSIGNFGKFHHINIIISNINISYFDIFSLASCRLIESGYLTISFSNSKNLSDLNMLNNLITQSSFFDFKLLRKNININTNSYIRFKSYTQSIKNNYEIISSGSFEKEGMGLFRTVFKHDISKAYWRWKYNSTISYSIHIFYKCNLIAYYGIRSYTVYYKSNVYIAAQIGDTMIHHNHRGGLKNGVFNYLFKFAYAYFQSIIEVNNFKTPIIGFGFPHSRHMKLAQRLGNYKNGGDLLIVQINKVQFDINTKIEIFKKRPINNNLNSINPNKYQKIWESMLSSFEDTCLISRDYDYFYDRYLLHPEFDYYIIHNQECIFILRDINSIDTYIMDIICNKNIITSNLKKLVDYFYHSNPNRNLKLWCLQHYFNDYLDDIAHIVDQSASFALLHSTKYTFLNEAQWWISMGDSDFL